MEDNDNKSLRSEKTRRVIGTDLSGIIRYGTAVMSILIFLFLAAAWFIPYPEILRVNAISVMGEYRMQVCAEVPCSYLSIIHEGMGANMEIDGYAATEKRPVALFVGRIDKECHNTNGQEFFTVYMEIASDNRISLSSGMTGSVSILISRKSILRKILY